ncbi:LacI family DNA-binding transcriptional regulator [Ferruginibacter sp. SUN106]|uniref:LacI family DNA-binding transcriptional regulator n=1 Tax=Ferruginibacter sp. SUN106 TaxID=2978348 RepID=UPI003D35D2BD
MDKLTIKTLAKELQLSVSTISKALRDSHEISAETKRKVLALAEQLNYTPNPYASSLRKRKSKTIGVVIPEVVNSFFSQSINGIESVAKAKGYHVLIYLTHENFENEKAILKDFESGRVDGVLLSVSRETTGCTHISELIEKEVPVIFFDRVFNEINTVKVTTNDFESAYAATTHLINSGCKNPHFVSIIGNLNIISCRMQGYKKALEDNGIPFTDNNIINCTTNFENNYNTLLKKLKAAKRPDGILCSIENLSIIIYKVCEDLNIKIPNDLQMISFSNLDTASFLNPPLTTITQPAYEIGQAAAATLVKALEKKNFVIPNETVVIPSVLTIRKSTKI